MNYLQFVEKDNTRVEVGWILEVPNDLSRDDVLKAIRIGSRPKGEWKQVSWKLPIAREVELLFHYKCDNCDKEVRIDHIERYNYCPHCGAKMRCEE